MKRSVSALRTRHLRWSLPLTITATLCYGQGVISTVAGNGSATAAGDGGLATGASFHPNGLTLDGSGNIYIADQNNNRIRKVDTNGIITTVAGNGGTQFSGDGVSATSTTVYIAANHNGLAVDSAGNLYIADDGHHRIRKVDVNGIITTVAGIGTQGFSGDGGAATKAQLWRPTGVAVDRAGSLYIADMLNSRIRKVDPSGTITTLAGNGAFANAGDGGPAVSASFSSPEDVAVDAAGNVYVADQNGYVVRKVNPAGTISTLAGTGAFGFSGDGGPAASAVFASPYSVAADSSGNVYISDFGNHRVRKVDAAGVITTVAGGGGGTNLNDGGPPTSANAGPAGVAFDSAGNYYIADLGNNRIRKVTVGAVAPGLSVSASSLYFSAPASGNTPAAQIVSVSTSGQVSLAFKMSFSTLSGGNWLNVTAPGGSTPSLMTVSISSTPPVGTYKANIVLTPTAPDLPGMTIPVTFNVVASAPAKPVITSVVSAATSKPGVAPNALVTIFGSNLASATDNWNSSLAGGQLPTSLDGVTVLFGGKPGYLSYISPAQINLLAPDVTTTSAGVLVTNSGATSSLVSVPFSPYVPAFFLWPGNQPVATRQDYTYAVKNGTFSPLSTVAAKPGDVLILWGTGFGPTTPATPPGVPVPGDKTYVSSAVPTVTINNIPATVYGAALASGYAGLYQVAIQVPASLADGDWPIVASAGGASSPSGVVLTVKQ